LWGEDPLVGKGRSRGKESRVRASTKGESRNASYLVIVESPAKARTINRYLGSEYVVEASMGHVRDLPKSRMGLDVNNGFEPEYIIISKARKTVSRLKKAAKGKKSIYLAPDPDREGEAISWHLSVILADTGADIYRVSFNEITKSAIQEAFKSPTQISKKLVDAQQARRILDRIVGYNLSPLLWKKIGRGLSAGRVQSIALRFIVEREQEIRDFKPEEYWSIQAKVSSRRTEIKDKLFHIKLDKIDGEKAEVKNKASAEAIKKELNQAPFAVAKLTTSMRRRRPQAPYTTSKLQQEAYTRLHFSAQKTMRLAQGMYEGVDIGGEEGAVGLITYMRTDSVHVSKQAHNELVKYIGETYGKEYLPDKPNTYKSKKQAQEAHEAIRPTSAFHEPEHLTKYLEADALKLYTLIWGKFVASQMKQAVDQTVTAEISAGKRYMLRATGSVNIFPGFLVVFKDVQRTEAKKEKGRDKEGDEEEDSGELPPLKEGEPLDLNELFTNQHFTKPPPRFNDASLIKLLEDAGIGRPSTYAPTIQTILYRDYVQRVSGALNPTELGETVTKLLVEHFGDIVDVNFTAYVEEELDKIEEGVLKWQDVIKEFYVPFKKDMDAAAVKIKDMRRIEIPTDYTCDVCGKPMVIKRGRFGKFIACTGFPDCKYTRSVPTGYRCPAPECEGDLIQLQSKRGQRFYGCSNYPKCRYTTNKLPKKEDGAAADSSEVSERKSEAA